MTPNRREFEKQCAFQKFCKSVLHNEACNAHEEIRRRRVREFTFSNLALHEERQLYTVDKYFQDEEAEPSYQQAGKKITPKLLLEAIRTLPEEKRTAILLYYFEGIGVSLGLSMNFEAVTARYVDVRLERKKEVLDAYHSAVEKAAPEKPKEAEPKKGKRAAKKKHSEIDL